MDVATDLVRRGPSLRRSQRHQSRYSTRADQNSDDFDSDARLACQTHVAFGSGIGLCFPTGMCAYGF